MKALLTSTPAYELSAALTPTPLGTSLTFSSFVPTAKRPEVQRRFETLLDRQGLRALRDLLDQALNEPPR